MRICGSRVKARVKRPCRWVLFGDMLRTQYRDNIGSALVLRVLALCIGPVANMGMSWNEFVFDALLK